MQFFFDTITRFTQDTCADQLLTLSEGHFKVELMKAFAHQGCALQEAYSKSSADYLFFNKNVFKWTRDVRLCRPQEGQCDITLVEPSVLFIELKTIPDRGPKATVSFNEVYEDVLRATRCVNNAFIFLFDIDAYSSFAKPAKRRKGVITEATRWFSDNLLEHVDGFIQRNTWNCPELLLSFWRIVPFGPVLVTGTRIDYEGNKTNFFKSQGITPCVSSPKVDTTLGGNT